MKKFRYSTWLLHMLLGALLALPAIAKERAKPVMITAALKSFSMTHNGETVMVMRNQDRSNRIVELYQPTYRGKIQPMHPFAPHGDSAIAMGDVQIAAQDGRSVPPGTGLDASGQSITDPAKIIKGVLLPFGGYKGSYIAMMIELLAGPLVGETASFASKERDSGDGGPPQGGQFILTMNPEILSGGIWQEQSEEFIKRLGQLDGVRLPAERRYQNRHNSGPREINNNLLQKIRSTIS